MTIYDISKKILAVLMLTAFTVFFFQGVSQAAQSEARMELERTINQVLGESQRPQLKNPATPANVLSRVEGIIRQLFSFH